MKPSGNQTRRVYVALIRGVNVGGNSLVRMADLKKPFESLGYVLYFAYSRKYDGIRRMIDFERAPCLSGTAIQIAGRFSG